MLAAAAVRIAEPVEAPNTKLCDALEAFLRTSNVAGDPDPAECDGVVLLERVDHGDSMAEFLGFSWLVTSQLVTPLRARFWPANGELKFEVRFGIPEIQVSQDELDRIFHRGAFPSWVSDWAVSLRS